MNHKELIYFIGSCLSQKDLDRDVTLKDQIGRFSVMDWEQLVWAGSSQLVLPGLWLSLQKSGLRKWLPEDLAEYLDDLLRLNRERNERLLQQCEQIARILDHARIDHLFLKGTAHLLDNRYEDIGQRMIGDIDLLVSATMLEDAAAALLESGYYQREPNALFSPVFDRHYPQLIHDNYPAGVDLHHRLLQKRGSDRNAFPDPFQNRRAVDLSSSSFLLAENQELRFNVLNVTENELQIHGNPVLLRNMVDLCILGKQRNVGKELVSISKPFKRAVRNYMALSSQILHCPELHPGPLNRHQRWFVHRAESYLSGKRLAKVIIRSNYVKFRLGRIMQQLWLGLVNREVRGWLSHRIGAKGWWQLHLQSYGRKN